LGAKNSSGIPDDGVGLVKLGMSAAVVVVVVTAPSSDDVAGQSGTASCDALASSPLS
jgi:hypothetical protein